MEQEPTTDAAGDVAPTTGPTRADLDAVERELDAWHDVPEPGDALEAEPWQIIAGDWSRRRTDAMRAHIGRVLEGLARDRGADDADGPPATVPSSVRTERTPAMQIWRRYSQFVFTERPEPLLADLLLTEGAVALELVDDDIRAIGAAVAGLVAEDFEVAASPVAVLANAAIALQIANDLEQAAVDVLGTGDEQAHALLVEGLAPGLWRAACEALEAPDDDDSGARAAAMLGREALRAALRPRVRALTLDDIVPLGLRRGSARRGRTYEHHLRSLAARILDDVPDDADEDVRTLWDDPGALAMRLAALGRTDPEAHLGVRLAVLTAEREEEATTAAALFEQSLEQGAEPPEDDEQAKGDERPEDEPPSSALPSATTWQRLVGRGLPEVPRPRRRGPDPDAVGRPIDHRTAAVLDALLSEGVPIPPLAPVEVGVLAAASVDRCMPAVGTEATDAEAVAEAELAVAAYLEALAFWEYGMTYDPIIELGSCLAERWAARREDLPRTPTAELAGRVVEAAHALTATIGREHQFGMEQANGSTDAERLARASDLTFEALSVVGEELVDLRHRLASTATEGAPTLRALVALLIEDVWQTAPFHLVLARAIGPCSALARRAIDDPTLLASPDVGALLDRAVDLVARYERSPAGTRSVSGTEARAHRTALADAAALIRSNRPLLHVADAEIAFVYPFGLPPDLDGDDPVRRLLRQHFTGNPLHELDRQPTFAGMTWELEDVPQTDAWGIASATDPAYDLAARLVPHLPLHWKLADGRVLRRLALEIRVGALGNHHLSITMSTDTAVEGSATGAPDLPGWTAHELDQFVRRSNADLEGEVLWFEPMATSQASEEQAEAPAGTGPPVASTLNDLAAQLVGELVGLAGRLAASRPPTDLEDDPEVRTGFAPAEDPFTVDPDALELLLARHVHVLVLVTRAEALHPTGERTSVTTPEALYELAGAPALLHGRRPFAQTPLEWVRYPDVHGLAGRCASSARIRHELIWCTGDTTVLFAPTLPNWQVLELREIVEYASSLIGVSWRRRETLQRSLQHAEAETREAPTALRANRSSKLDAPLIALDDAPTALLRSQLLRAQEIERQLDGQLNHIQTLLDRARAFEVSSDPQTREVIDHLCRHNGVTEMQRALRQSIDSAGSLQRLVRARVERLQAAVSSREEKEKEDRRRRDERPLQLLVGVLAVFSFIDLFWWLNDAWFSETSKLSDRGHIAFIVEVSLLAVIAVLVGIQTVRVLRRDGGADPGQ